MSSTAISDADTASMDDHTPIVALNAHDRCDTKACGAQAYVRFEKNFQDLLFCHHHGNKVEKGLTDAGFFIIQDERANLGASRTQGSEN